MKFLQITLLILLGFLESFSQEILRGPYLQNLTPESINVIWRTSDSLIGNVWVGTSPEDLSVKYTNSTKTINHNIKIDGLEPGMTYYYAVGYGETVLAGSDLTHHFKTAPVNGTIQPIKFWAIGDFGKANQPQIDVRKSFENSEHIDKTDFWLWLGDNAYADGTDKEYQERVFAKPYGYDSILRFLPFFPVPGNHDYNSVNRFDNPAGHHGPYFRMIDVPTQGEAGGVPSNTKLYYSFDYGNVHFVALNSEAFQYTFFDNTPMIQWLREDLQKNKKEWTIVFWHQTPYTKGSHDSDEGWELFMKSMRERINPIIETFGVDLVLTGHSHVYERSYLINGHYGNSNSFRVDKHVVQGTSGDFDKGEHYIKYLKGENAKKGTVYVTVGNSGSYTNESSLDHPIHYFTDGGPQVCGSLIVDIVGNRLDAYYMQKDGNIADKFTIFKPDGTDTSQVITSIKPLEILEEISIFPIPTTGKVYTSFSLKESQRVRVNLIDVTGKYISNLFESNLSSGKNNIELNINRKGVSSGNYFLQFDGEKGSSTQKIVLVK